jgi:protein-L-isoaspartate O-methyltransferase
MTARPSLRQRMADALVAEGVVRSRWLHRAFAQVPREVFVARFHRPYPGDGLVDGADPAQQPEWLAQVYTDQVLVVQYTSAPGMHGAGAPTSSSSQPSVMAGMLEALDLQPGHRVLEIGTGTGYNAALLCQRVGAHNVTTVELDPGLADSARVALGSLELHPRVVVGDGAAGVAEAAPFDRIIATASTGHIPPAWINQLTPGGIIVVDLRGPLAGGLIRLTSSPQTDSEAVHGRFLELPGAFMPLRSRPGSAYRKGVEDWESIVYDRRNPQRTTTEVDPGLVAHDPSLRFLIQLHLAGNRLRGFHQPVVEGGELAGRANDGSWCSVNRRPDIDGRYTVEQAGPRRLWDSVEAAYATWRILREPGIGPFGVTAYDDIDHQYVWFERDDSAYRWPLPL